MDGGYVIRDGALPSLLGRYVYADIYDVFGGELRTVQLFAGGSSGDAGLGVFATNVVSFGEDACAHIYVAAIGGTVYRLEPAGGPFPCSPQAPPNTEPTPGPAQPPATTQPSPPAATCSGERATIVGTRGRDVLQGSARRDVIAGLGGNDRLSGLKGNDLLCGGKGGDTILRWRRKGSPAGPRPATTGSPAVRAGTATRPAQAGTSSGPAIGAPSESGSTVGAASTEWRGTGWTGSSAARSRSGLGGSLVP